MEPKCNTIGCTNICGGRKTHTLKSGKTKKYYGKLCNQCVHLKARYGITCVDRDRILKQQNHKCGICKHPISITGRGTKRNDAVIDHQETPFKIRGMLCGTCNTSLGGLGDSVENLENAIAYLKKS